MPTSIHIPRELLEAVDRRAKTLKMSRNQLIVRAIQSELNDRSTWSPGFFEALAQVDRGTVAAVDDMMNAIRGARTRKKAPRL